MTGTPYVEGTKALQNGRSRRDMGHRSRRLSGGQVCCPYRLFMCSGPKLSVRIIFGAGGTGTVVKEEKVREVF